jgi:hypothetical protein
MLHSIWQQAPRALTYWWFSTLRHLLFPFQILCTASRYQQDGAFTSNQNELTISAELGPGAPVIGNSLDEYAYQFKQRWSSTSLTNSTRSFEERIQEDHFRTLLVARAPKVKSQPREKDSGDKKRQRDGDHPHFTASKPLFELMGELPRRPSAVPGKFLHFMGSAGAPMFRLKDRDGKLRQIV